MKFDEYHKMSEMEQLKAEDEFIHTAFLNSYLLLTGKKEQEDFLGSNMGLVVAHNLVGEEEEVDEDVEGVIEYFAGMNDFAKCIELRDRKIKK
jgi:hypothetical protein